MAKLPHKKLLQLNPKVKLALLDALLNRNGDKGVAVPIAIALSLVMIAFAVVGILRAYEERIATSSQRSAATALSAAEIALAKYQELLDKNRMIATFPACNTWTNANGVAGDGNGDDNEACGDTGSLTTWKRASNISGVSDLACPGAGTTVVANATTRIWQLINASNSSLGQYRLVDYSYSSTTSSATLTVEGRVRQNTDQPATARLRATIPVQPGLPQTSSPPNLQPRLNKFDPALWIGSSSVTNIGNNLKVNGNIIVSDSNCNVPTGANQPGAGNLSFSSTQLVMADPRSLPTTIALGNGNNDIGNDDSDRCDRNDANDIINCLDNATLIANEDSNNNGSLDPGEDTNGNHCLDNKKLPRTCETEDANHNGVLDAGEDLNGNGLLDDWSDLKDSNNYYHYLIRDNLNLPDGTILKIAVGTKVILYVQGNITFTGNVIVNPGEDLNGNGIKDAGEDSNINGILDVNNSAFLEIYGNTLDGGSPKYGCQNPPLTCPTTTTAVNFNGTGTIRLTGFIHAPGATVNVTGSPTVKLTGAMWINNWNGNSASFNLTSDDQYYNYLSRPNIVAPIVYPPSSQEIQEAD